MDSKTVNVDNKNIRNASYITVNILDFAQTGKWDNTQYLRLSKKIPGLKFFEGIIRVDNIKSVTVCYCSYPDADSDKYITAQEYKLYKVNLMTGDYFFLKPDLSMKELCNILNGKS